MSGGGFPSVCRFMCIFHSWIKVLVEKATTELLPFYFLDFIKIWLKVAMCLDGKPDL